jgi:hypothetical protein
LVVVEVIAVGGVLLTIMIVVGVVAVLDSSVTASFAVLVGVLGNFVASTVFVGMGCMVRMQMAVVFVIHVIAVAHFFVAARFAVGVRVVRVFVGALSCIGGHRRGFSRFRCFGSVGCLVRARGHPDRKQEAGERVQNESHLSISY